MFGVFYGFVFFVGFSRVIMGIAHAGRGDGVRFKARSGSDAVSTSAQNHYCFDSDWFNFQKALTVELFLKPDFKKVVLDGFLSH